ncbi:alkaline phosphatase [Saccharothrix sp. ALI-22-I]|uniref:DedA family protein n=1 Tax=Saccharothrix sp. ALI-22-I TaxID=1933778 RepID=UPI00097C0250|nr:DedA family protein [Saccharothrix sp. ALI-22-I]ONI92315.1 alkaline phosphatase [Saccharothrix sp. ALI-22-I]
MNDQLPGILGEVASALDRYGYVAVFSTVFVESFGVPAPGQTVLVVAGIYAGTGHLNVFGVALVALLAAVVGDSLGYMIGRLGGRPLVLKVGRYVFLTDERLRKAEGFFVRHGNKVVVAARFVDGLRQVNGVVAGVVRMPWPRFVTFNAIGAVLWVALWTLLGYLAGDHVTVIYDDIRRYQGYLLVALGCLLVVGLVLALRHRRGRSQRRR